VSLRQTFKKTPPHILEKTAMHYEERLASLLYNSSRQAQRKVHLLHQICNILWKAIALEERAKLSHTAGKALFQEFSHYKRELQKL